MTTDPAPHRLTVLGAGVMGTGIATLAIGHGVPVRLIDVDQPTLDRARNSIAAQLRHARLLAALPERTEGELVTTTAIADAADSTAVVEAVTESPKIKDAVLGEVSTVVAPGTPLISNTSGIPIDELAGSVRDPGDLLGTHFMNPTYLIDMVEVIAGPRTTGGTLAAADALLAAMGRRRVVVRDSPGFVTSRLLHPMINAAARLVGDGVASVEDVDALMQGCLGHPTGPLRTADLIGIDNLVDSLLVLHERTGDESCRPCTTLQAKVEAGDLGRKTGRGFYEYGKALLS